MLKIEQLSISYEQKEVVHNFSFEVEQGEILSIIGPNGSGKSTILKAIARMQPYSDGNILFEGENMRRLSSKEIARKMCMLSQQNQAPSDISVKSLVAYGRYPHKKWFERLNAEDEAIIDWALEKTYLSQYKEKPIAALSGGEAQRAWIAMALAQRPQVLLLDEPTTFLDIAHQHEVLELVRELNRDMGMTVVMVLHDLNQASSYSDKIVVVKDGNRAQIGTPDEVMTEQMIQQIYRMEAEIQYVSWDNAPRIQLKNTVRV
ncbi:ABC transporter ATP-binding protein [Lysinibacillus sp. FSL M8-0216]|uniref:Iron complex transport system ATP-binding protein n=1 Tax=Lysinibacillus fusiformis TaxID=28031 RepID=A0A1H9D274_9BACI|nr:MULTISPECIES: ABC transporter ATP-binding protein [Lysinibacillus]MED4668710.1 ABC transporter ATP-binding protein [Lysinibacillus fusiformis]QAS59090.1 ABC transporter ATP-binding protein [Lysinibacillus sphaericus]RDV28472.1 ABC transporter ATP-binding protein [Lysinibacillus fusiformis]SCX37472.1 iron complex transport system ATP-binding protein [Lysinibacillus fusiformis]SCY05395.1 iron complex transport system ATP-binding protein [Lysinibacillus fusiformis]